MRITTPKNLTEAKTRLRGIDQLLRAREWERSAILATVVRLHDGPGQPKSIDRSVNTLTPMEFAALEIPGLLSHVTVRKYVQAWLDEVGDYPKPAKSVTLPTAPWPPTRQGTDGYASEDGLRSTLERAVSTHGSDGVQSVLTDVVGHAPKPSQPLPPVASEPMMASPVSEYREAVSAVIANLNIMNGAIEMMGGVDGMRPDDRAQLANVYDVWDATIGRLMKVSVEA